MNAPPFLHKDRALTLVEVTITTRTNDDGDDNNDSGTEMLEKKSEILSDKSQCNYW